MPLSLWTFSRENLIFLIYTNNMSIKIYRNMNQFAINWLPLSFKWVWSPPDFVIGINSDCEAICNVYLLKFSINLLPGTVNWLSEENFILSIYSDDWAIIVNSDVLQFSVQLEPFAVVKHSSENFILGINSNDSIIFNTNLF